MTMLPEGHQWATMDTITGEKDLHVKGTMRKSKKGEPVYAFHMFNPDIPQDRDQCRVRCGMCRHPMDGFKSCPNCYPDR